MPRIDALDLFPVIVTRHRSTRRVVVLVPFAELPEGDDAHLPLEDLVGHRISHSETLPAVIDAARLRRGSSGVALHFEWAGNVRWRELDAPEVTAALEGLPLPLHKWAVYGLGEVLLGHAEAGTPQEACDAFPGASRAVRVGVVRPE